MTSQWTEQRRSGKNLAWNKIFSTAWITKFYKDQQGESASKDLQEAQLWALSMVLGCVELLPVEVNDECVLLKATKYQAIVRRTPSTSSTPKLFNRNKTPQKKRNQKNRSNRCFRCDAPKLLYVYSLFHGSFHSVRLHDVLSSLLPSLCDWLKALQSLLLSDEYCGRLGWIR